MIGQGVDPVGERLLGVLDEHGPVVGTGGAGRHDPGDALDHLDQWREPVGRTHGLDVLERELRLTGGVRERCDGVDQPG